ncbi:MAG: DedA family protein [Candidatus Taylorbacteria bacterium]|nr:DedA family protein [Candidatus Taylorbacteria bacterium]
MLEVLIAQYGLIAVFIGAFLEGEIVVIAGGLLARLEFLSLTMVLIVAIVATFLGDLCFFQLGRKKGSAFLEKRPHLKRRSERVRSLVHDHHNKILFFYRFLYGIRIPTLLALGTSELTTKKFVLINLFNSVLWSAIFVLGGYFFGDVFTKVVGDIKAYEREIVMGLGAVALVVWVGSFIKNRIEYD